VKSEWWGQADRYRDPAAFWVLIVGRLKEGVSITRAQEEASALFRNEMVHGAKPLLKEADEPAIRLAPAAQGLNGETRRIAPMLYVNTAAVCLVLLIACAKRAGLMVCARRETTKRDGSAVGTGSGQAANCMATSDGECAAVDAGWSGGRAGGGLGRASHHEANFERFRRRVSIRGWAGLAGTGVHDWRDLCNGNLVWAGSARSGARAELTAGLKENEMYVVGG